MGWKGLIRDIVMFFVAYQLLAGSMEKSQLALILIIVAGFFTILAWFKFLGLRC